MTDDILQAHHKKFKYVYISSDINDPVKELEFEGTEEQFQKKLNAHFRRIILGDKGKAEFRDILKEKIGEQKNANKESTQINDHVEKEKDKEKKVGVSEKKENNHPSPQSNPLLETDTLGMLIDSASSYQIVPLTLPTKETNFLGVNCYIDDVGKLKNLPYNSRASRICNTDINGDAFLSKTYDNEDFKRVDFKIEEFEQYLKNPPKKSHFSYGENMQNLMNSVNSTNSFGINAEKKEKSIICSNCFKEGNLKKCGKCKKVYYCSVECQRKDFVFHQRIC